MPLLQIDTGGSQCEPAGSVASPRRTVCGSRSAAGSRRRDDSGRLPVKHQRVLVVDDDPDIRRLVSAYLRREGMEVITAEDGETALMHEATQQPDIVVLDLMLPGIGGLDVLRTIRERGTAARRAADGAGRGHGPRPGPRVGRRRLRDQAVSPARAGGPRPLHSATGAGGASRRGQRALARWKSTAIVARSGETESCFR